jgi:alpha-galactosidase
MVQVVVEKMKKLPALFLALLFLSSCKSKSPSENVSIPGLPFYAWAPTPPMGWNSWDCYGPTVVESEVKANADYMAGHLKNFGWEYIVVDIRWYVANDKSGGYNEKDPVYNIDKYGRFLPAVNRFPSSSYGKGFKPLADYIHNKGLKFGIHVMRGVPVIAVRDNLQVLGTDVTARDIYSSDGQCRWLKDMYTVDHTKKGAQEYYNSIMDLYASWGVDFLKIDDLSSPYHAEEIAMIRKAIDRTGRQIVLSTSPGPTPVDEVCDIRQNANMWRTVGDLWDNWPQFKEEFSVLDKWSPYVAAGTWPDGDMLPLGHIGIRAERGADRMSNLTRDEQYTLMTLFSIFRSPLMFGGNLPDNDDFTLSLITNKDVLEVNQQSANGKQLFRENDLIAWTSDDPKTGDKYLALFNTSDQQPIIESKAIWKTEQITQEASDQSVDIDIDITGAKKLYLVTSFDDLVGFASHNCDWIEPKLISPKGSVNLTDLKWVKASAGRGEPSINQTARGEKLTVNGREYKNGISANATSIIEYDLPEGVTRFRAKAGLDNGTAGRGFSEQGNNRQFDRPNNAKFLVFTEDPAGPVPADTAEITVKFEQLGLRGTHSIRDLWTGEKLGKFTDSFSRIINRHGAGLYRIH